MRLALSFARAVHFAQSVRRRGSVQATAYATIRAAPTSLKSTTSPHVPVCSLSPPRPRRLPNAPPIPLKPVGSSPMWGLLVGKVLDLIRSTGTSMTNFAVNVGAGAHAGHACSRAMPLGAR